jgi:hypothetical protein
VPGSKTAFLPVAVSCHSVEHLPPGCEPAEHCVVLFPSDDALLPSEVDPLGVKRVFIIDSRWAKAKEINVHPGLAGMRRVCCCTSQRMLPACLPSLPTSPFPMEQICLGHIEFTPITAYFQATLILCMSLHTGEAPWVPT